MNIKIKYCKPCRYWGQGLKDAQELFVNHGKDIETIAFVAGDNGIYEVFVDDQRIFSNQVTNRFPEEGELNRLMTEAQR